MSLSCHCHGHCHNHCHGHSYCYCRYRYFYRIIITIIILTFIVIVLFIVVIIIIFFGDFLIAVYFNHIEVSYTVKVFTPQTSIVTSEFRLFTLLVGSGGKMTEDLLLHAPRTTSG